MLVLILGVLFIIGFLVVRDCIRSEREENERQAQIEAERQKALEEKRRAEDSERQKILAQMEMRAKVEAKKAAMTQMVAEIPSVPVSISAAPAELISVRALDNVTYSNITTRTNRAELGNFVAIDVETTGLRIGNEIVSVAAVRFEDFEPTEKISSLCFPQKGINPEAERINHISAEMVDGKPTFREIAESIQAFIGNSNVVGYNLGFDLGFITKYGVNLTTSKRKYFDALDLARRTFPDCYNYKLETVCNYCGILMGETHQSEMDAVAVGLLFKKISDERL